MLIVFTFVITVNILECNYLHHFDETTELHQGPGIQGKKCVF